MTTLLIPLAGPLQCWGLDARFGERGTAPVPSKSGVLGLLCAALGRDRAEAIDDLAALRMGVRIDRAGTLLRDYHTALDVVSADGSNTGTAVSHRWYLADAAFLCGFEGPEALLRTVHGALSAPVWPVFLGRKACLPALPLHDPQGLSHQPLVEALRSHPRLFPADTDPDPMRLVVEDGSGSQIVPDQPLSPFIERRFGARRVRTEVHAWN